MVERKVEVGDGDYLFFKQYWHGVSFSRLKLYDHGDEPWEKKQFQPDFFCVCLFFRYDPAGVLDVFFPVVHRTLEMVVDLYRV